MRVAVVDSDLPYPPSSGKRLRSLNLMLPLAKRHHLTYVCRGRAGSAEAMAATELLSNHGIGPVLYDGAVPRKSGVGFWARLAVAILAGGRNSPFLYFQF
jgi:hypothetical protein